MTKPELAERLAATINDLEQLEVERKAVMENFRHRRDVLRADLREFCENVHQMRLDDAEAGDE